MNYNHTYTESILTSKSEQTDTKSTIVKSLIALLNAARRTESAKMDLACNPDFNLHDAFTIMSIEDKKGSLCSRDIFLDKFDSLNPTVRPLKS